MPSLMPSRLLVILLLAAPVLWTACSSGPPADATAAPDNRTRVETLRLTPTSFQDAIEITGSVESLNDVRISAQAAGTVERLRRLGTFLQTGDTLAVLDQDIARANTQQAQANYEAAQAQFDLAEDSYQRQLPLYKDSILSALEFQQVRTNYQQARAQLVQAKAAVAQAQKQLRNTVVLAPFSGTVEEHFIEVGEQAGAGAPLVRLVSTQRVRVRVGVPERYASDIEEGTSVKVAFQAYGIAPRTAPVTFVGRTINPQSRTFPIEIELENPGGLLKPEMVARVVLPRNELQNALVIPRAAVIRSENGNSVFTVKATDSTKVAQRQPVQLGPAYGGAVVVAQGLQPSDEVVVLGQTDLTEGVAVEVVQQYTSIEEAANSFRPRTPAPETALPAPTQPAPSAQ